MHATHVSAHTSPECAVRTGQHNFGGDHGLVDLSHYHYNNHLAAVAMAMATKRLLTLIPIGERSGPSFIISRNYPHHRQSHRRPAQPPLRIRIMRQTGPRPLTHWRQFARSQAWHSFAGGFDFSRCNRSHRADSEYVGADTICMYVGRRRWWGLYVHCVATQHNNIVFRDCKTSVIRCD